MKPSETDYVLRLDLTPTSLPKTEGDVLAALDRMIGQPILDDYYIVTGVEGFEPPPAGKHRLGRAILRCRGAER